MNEEKNKISGSLDVRREVLVDLLGEEGFVVDYLLDGNPGVGYGFCSVEYYYNICDGPAMKIDVRNLHDMQRELIEKDKKKNVEGIDYNGYFVERVVLSGSDNEIKKFKPILEKILDDPGNKYKYSSF